MCLCSLIVGFVWMFIFNQMTASLYQQTGWGIFTANWLSDPNLAFFALLIVCVWQGAGYYMVIYIAGLNNIDYSYREAAAIDGANRFQQFQTYHTAASDAIYYGKSVYVHCRFIPLI